MNSKKSWADCSTNCAGNCKVRGEYLGWSFKPLQIDLKREHFWLSAGKTVTSTCGSKITIDFNTKNGVTTLKSAVVDSIDPSCSCYVAPTTTTTTTTTTTSTTTTTTVGLTTIKWIELILVLDYEYHHHHHHHSSGEPNLSAWDYLQHHHRIQREPSQQIHQTDGRCHGSSQTKHSCRSRVGGNWKLPRNNSDG